MSEQLHHPTVPVLVWADIDAGIADFVRYLNLLPGIRTHASCQGGQAYGPQVMVSWADDAALALLTEFPMTPIGDNHAYVYPANFRPAKGAAEIEALRTALTIATQRAETQADTIDRMTRQGAADGAAIERMHRALRAVQNITEATHAGTGQAYAALSRIAVVVREGMRHATTGDAT